MAKTGKKQNFRVDVMPGSDIIAHFLLLDYSALVCHRSPIITIPFILSAIKWFPTPTSDAIKKVDSPLRERKALRMPTTPQSLKVR